MTDGLKQQVNKYSQLLSLAPSQETQDDGGTRRSAGLALKFAACFAAQTAKQDPVQQTANTVDQISYISYLLI